MGRKPEVRRSTYPPVVAYEEDVHAWMYLDQVDGVLRYEAYVIGYDETGSPTTLEFVIEEGVLDLRRFPQIFPFLPRALRRRLEGATGSQGDAGDHTDAAARDGAAGARAAGEQESARERAADYRGDAGQGKADGPSAPAAEPWNPEWLRRHAPSPWDLAPWQWEGLHAFCEQEERRLKEECRPRWTRRLRALGYDVIRSL